MSRHATTRAGGLTFLALWAAGAGCAHSRPIPAAEDMPRELDKKTLPDYVIEPPDVLEVALLHAVPKAPYRIQTLDSLGVRVTPVLPDAPPIAGVYPVGPDGVVAFGGPYGSVKVSGLTLDEAKAQIEKAMTLLKNPSAEVTLAQTRGAQQVRGPHLVRPDGSVGLGTYGAVRVVGLTLPEAKQRLEEHLAAYFEKPEVAVDVTGYNSKVYYVIYDGGGAGQQISRQPVTGNETVLDAVGQLSGLPPQADARRIWISRPAAAGCACQTLPVDWNAITECADPRTNYQLMPGDRLFVKAYRATAAEVALSRVFAPVERVLGVTLLGVSTARAFTNFDNNGLNGLNGNNLFP